MLWNRCDVIYSQVVCGLYNLVFASAYGRPSRLLGTSLPQILHIVKFSIMMLFIVVLSVSISSATLHTFDRRSKFNNLRTLWSFLDINSCPAQGSYSKLSGSSSESLYYLKTKVCDMPSFFNICRIMPDFSVPDFLSPTQNLMANRCSIVRCILC